MKHTLPGSIRSGAIYPAQPLLFLLKTLEFIKFPLIPSFLKHMINKDKIL